MQVGGAIKGGLTFAQKHISERISYKGRVPRLGDDAHTRGRLFARTCLEAQCLCVSCVALCVGRSAASCGPLSRPSAWVAPRPPMVRFPFLFLRHSFSACRPPPLLRCSRTWYPWLESNQQSSDMEPPGGSLGLTRSV